MSDSVSRRDVIKTLGLAGVGALVPDAPLMKDEPGGVAPAAGAAQPRILEHTSTTGVFVPPRGRSFMKFSFDFPEPSVTLDACALGVMVFTHENAYGLDRSAMMVEQTQAGARLTATGLVWAGGQQRAPGRVVLDIRRITGGIEWDVTAEMSQPIKSVATVLRGVPRGRVSTGGEFFDPEQNELLLGYPFGGGDLFVAGGLTTPQVIVRRDDGRHVSLSSLDTAVRTKRFYLQPGEGGYRVELVHEVEGWRHEQAVRVPPWRLLETATAEEAWARHYDHVRAAYAIPDFDARPDVPAWLRRTALVTTLHGMHYTGYVFNDYARMLETLRWMATQIPGDRILAFLSAWDGRYYWNYPDYEVDPRMGGDAGFRRLVGESQALGIKVMPMFGANAANRGRASWARVGDAATAKVDGDAMDLNWVDWDNDRHHDGWLSYMNLGVDSWREWLAGRIAHMIDTYGVDAYFLDIIGGWTNNTKADMHDGARRLVADLRARYPGVLAVGEMHYDALLAFLPLYHAGGGGPAGAHIRRHARFFQHLSLPAPGRGSSGVHEAGFGRFNQATLALSESAIPTLNVVDDTFARHRDTMAAVIAKARERAGIA